VHPFLVILDILKQLQVLSSYIIWYVDKTDTYLNFFAQSADDKYPLQNSMVIQD